MPEWLKRLFSRMPETDDSLGDRIFNKTVEAANNAETDEERKKIYNESAKNNLAVTGMSLMGIPMLNEFATYGLLGGGLRVGSGLAGSKVGEYAFGKAGDYGDKKLNTNFLGTTGRILGGFAGYGAGRTGMDLGIKSISGVERLASRGNFTVYNPDYYKGRQREVAKDIITGRDDAWNYLGSDRKAITDLYNEKLYNRVKSHLKTQDSFSIENFPLRRSTIPMKNPGTLDPDMEWVGTNNNGFILYSGSENEAGATTRYLHHPELDEMYLSKSYDLDDTSFHEYLHRGNVGLGMNDGTRKFYNWKNQWLLKPGFENFRDKYLTNPEETAVNLIEIGRRADILDAPYQGANNTRAIIQDIIKNDPLQGSLLNQTRWETKPKRVWDALQGKYMGIIPIGIGLMNYDRNDNKTTTKGDN